MGGCNLGSWQGSWQRGACRHSWCYHTSWHGSWRRCACRHNLGSGQGSWRRACRHRGCQTCSNNWLGRRCRFRTGTGHSLHCHRRGSCTQSWGWGRNRSLAGLGCVRVASGQLLSRKQVHRAGPQQSLLHLLALEHIFHHCIPIFLRLEVLVNHRLLALICLSIYSR